MATVTTPIIQTHPVSGTYVSIGVALDAGEVIVSVEHYAQEDYDLGINDAGLERGWTFACPASELPASGANLNYSNVNYAYGVNKWRFVISNGTTTTNLETVNFPISFSTVRLCTTYKNGGSFASVPLLKEEFEGLLQYIRNGDTHNIVHKIPGRTGRPLVKYRAGGQVRSSFIFMFGNNDQNNAEARLVGIESLLGAAGELIIRRPNIPVPNLPGAMYPVPDVRGAVERYVVRHGEVPSEEQQVETKWFIDVDLTENKAV